jgi:hypothetical protein
MAKNLRCLYRIPMRISWENFSTFFYLHQLYAALQKSSCLTVNCSVDDVVEVDGMHC